MLNLFQWNETQIFTFFFVMIRVTSLMFFLPLFGDRTIPPTIKIMFGLAFSCMIFPVCWSSGLRVDPNVMSSSARLVWAVAGDAMFGAMIGFVARWIFDAVQTAGYFAGTSMGFSIATVLDPHSESQTIALSEMLYILSAMLFLSLDGHHIYLSAIMHSFKVVPLTSVNLIGNDAEIIRYLILMTSEVLLLGVKLAAPVLVVVLLINLTFGIMARAVPQMNVLTVSFSANIIVGLFVVLVSMPGFINMVSGAFDSYTPELFRFMRLFGG